MTNEVIPEVIVAMRVVNYATEQIVQDIAEVSEKTIGEVTLEEVMEWIQDNASEDLAYSGNNIIYQDGNGGEIEL